MKILRQADYRTMPWKNGGGETTEIVVSPPAASLDDFDWRISMARVKGDGPFSIFTGIDRTLSILNGQGMNLSIDGAAHTLTQDSAPLPFPADVPTTATLVDGAITDLNVMSRRGVVRHNVERVALTGTKTIATRGEDLVVFCDQGVISISGPGREQQARLETRDTLIEDNAHGAWVISGAMTVEKPSVIYVIWLRTL